MVDIVKLLDILPSGKKVQIWTTLHPKAPTLVGTAGRLSYSISHHEEGDGEWEVYEMHWVEERECFELWVDNGEQ